MVTCAVTTSVLGCIVTSYLFFRYTWYLDLSLVQKSLIFASFILAGCIPLLVSYNMEHILGRFYPFYRYALYFVFIGCIILFTLTLLSDAVFFVLSYTPLVSKVKICCCYMNYVLVGLAVVCSAYALYAGMKVPEIKSITIVSDKLAANRKIVLLSDIHIHRAICPEKIKGIVEKTNALNPDIILLAGDIIDDDARRVSGVTSLLKGLKAKEGIYFVTGNHEFYAGYTETVAELQRLGFKFLENSGISLKDIYLAGAPDLFSGEAFGKKIDLDRTFAESRPNQFRLLMSHTPEDFGHNNNFDLEVSGHTHGGQIFPFHIFTKLHNKYLSGLYPMAGNARIYVSNGAGQWGPQMRFLAPSEITLLNLTTPKQKGQQ